jgi:hypothetical protein
VITRKSNYISSKEGWVLLLKYNVHGETTVEILYLWNANSNTRKIDMPNHPPMHRLNSKIQLIEKSKIIIIYPVQIHLWISDTFTCQQAISEAAVFATNWWEPCDNKNRTCKIDTSTLCDHKKLVPRKWFHFFLPKMWSLHSWHISKANQLQFESKLQSYNQQFLYSLCSIVVSPDKLTKMTQ